MHDLRFAFRQLRQSPAVAALFTLIFSSAVCFGQDTSAEEADAIYSKFSEAYGKLDAEAVAKLYSTDAVLSYLYENSTPSSLVGRDAIRKSFVDFFQPFADQKTRLALSFKIADRKVSGDTVLDNGFYKLEFVTPENERSATFGKFSTVLTRAEGQLKFKADSSASARVIEYENVASATIPKGEDFLDPAFYDDLLGDYVDEKSGLTVIGRSLTRLYAYSPTNRAFRGLKKVSATTWTSGQNVIPKEEVVQKFVFSEKDGARILEIFESDRLIATARKQLLYRTDKLSFAGPGGTRLGGTLFLPLKQNGKALVLVHGSGAQDRNGYASIIRVLADVIARSGVTVLTYDKRGVGESQGDWGSESFSDLADDALAGVRYLQGRKDLALDRIGLGGSSQAAWIMAKVVEKSSAVDFVLAIDAAGSAISVAEQNLYNTEVMMRCAGLDQRQIETALKQQELFLEFVQRRTDGKPLDEFTQRAAQDEKLRDWLFPASREIDFANPKQWFTALETGFDPLPVWKAYQKPALMIFSEFDDSTPTQKVFSRLSGLPKKNLTLRRLSGAQHLGLEATSVCRADLEHVEKFHQDFFDTITRWLGQL